MEDGDGTVHASVNGALNVKNVLAGDSVRLNAGTRTLNLLRSGGNYTALLVEYTGFSIDSVSYRLPNSARFLFAGTRQEDGAARPLTEEEAAERMALIQDAKEGGVLVKDRNGVLQPWEQSVDTDPISGQKTLSVRTGAATDEDGNPLRNADGSLRYEERRLQTSGAYLEKLAGRGVKQISFTLGDVTVSFDADQLQNAALLDDCEKNGIRFADAEIIVVIEPIAQPNEHLPAGYAVSGGAYRIRILLLINGVQHDVTSLIAGAAITYQTERNARIAMLNGETGEWELQDETGSVHLPGGAQKRVALPRAGSFAVLTPLPTA